MAGKLYKQTGTVAVPTEITYGDLNIRKDGSFYTTNEANELIEMTKKSDLTADITTAISNHNTGAASHNDIRTTMVALQTAAVQTATIGGTAVPKNGTDLQLPAYPTLSSLGAATTAQVDTAQSTANAALPKTGGTMSGVLVAGGTQDLAAAQTRNFIIQNTTPTSIAIGTIVGVYK